MKPRLFISPPFEDLFEVWPHLQMRWAAKYGLHAAEQLAVSWIAADRRDADLMYMMAKSNDLGWWVAAHVLDTPFGCYIARLKRMYALAMEPDIFKFE